MSVCNNGEKVWESATEVAAERNSSKSRRLVGKIAIVTGAGHGIGRTIALRFAAEGAEVVIADIDADGAIDAAIEIQAEGGKAQSWSTDITDPHQIQSLIVGVMARYGQVDILVNNAAVELNQPFLDTSLNEWNRLLEVALTGTFLCSQAAARVMVTRAQGSIINVASISGQHGIQGQAACGVAKAGVIHLTRVMAVELAAKGIRVNAISPGPVVTDQHNGTQSVTTRQSEFERIPMYRYGERNEIADAAIFLASSDSAFVHGHILNVDGGFQAASSMIDSNVD